MNILILEDERRNYNHLRRMIEAMDRTFRTIGPAASIQEAVEYMRHGEVADIILADIRLSDGLSFEAFNREPPSVPVIFTTAYDEYAIKAFKYNAIDYLLKPVDADELEAAIRRARQMVARPVEGDPGQLFKQLGHGATGTARGFCCRGATATDRCWCATSTMCSPRIRCRDCA